MRLTSNLIAAAMAGISLGALGCASTETPAQSPSATPDATTDISQKHGCRGQNACKGQGGCKTDAHACKGQNACKGQGGCHG
jgi:hypothetical protein